MIHRARLRVFHGWWMVASGVGIQLLVAGLLMQSYGAYVVLLREDFGWSKTALSAAYSLQQVAMGVLSPIEGWIIDRFGPRAVMRIGMVIFGLGFMALSQIQSLSGFFVVILIVAIGASLTGFFPLTVAIVNWFEKRRARALSLMSLGFAFGGMAVPIIALSLETIGWRGTAFLSGVIILVVGLPLVQVIRRRPEDQGEVMDGIPGAAVAAASESETDTSRDFTAREAIRTPAFWLISFGHGSALLVVSAVIVHIIVHLTESLGYSLGTAALVFTLMTAVQVFGIILGGFLGDRFDKRLIAAACMVMHAVGLLLVAYATVFAMVIAFAVLHGLAWGMRGPLMQAMRADYFGRSSFGVIMGFSTMIIMIGQIAGPLIAGVLADATGGYKAGFTVLAVFAGLASGFFLFARRPVLPRRPAAVSADERQPVDVG